MSSASGDTKTVFTGTRLKREDCKHTKHDSAFSHWKILIGSSDWEDYLMKKEGVEKYRTHNLPNCSSCPGLYELGIAVLGSRSGRGIGKLDKNCIIPVYLGQADNVRTRLQQYGREGAHLENESSNSELNDGKGRGLFTEIFSRGFSIVYRWAPVYNKKDAEKAERQLLDTFDYAWNKGCNSARRPDDILQKLDHGTSSATLTSIVRKLQNFRQGQVGLKIKTCKPLVLDNGPTLLTNLENHGIFSRIFKFGKSRPVLVPLRLGINEDRTTICGVALGQGSVCTRPPVEGRKRCPEHKGMKVNGSSSKLKKEGKFRISDPSTGSSIVSDLDEIKDFTTNCGAALDDGSSCTNEPVQGRKRCAVHKGMKICGIRSELVMEGKQRNVHGAVVEPGTHCDDQVQFQVFAESSCGTKDGNTICGIYLEDGTICTRQPGLGRKRCEEHKGLRVYKHTAMLKAKMPTIFDVSGVDRGDGQSVSYRNSFNDDFSSTCGAITRGGSFCKRKLATGGKFCWQHEGMMLDTSSRTNTYNELTSNGTSSDQGSHSCEWKPLSMVPLAEGH